MKCIVCGHDTEIVDTIKLSEVNKRYRRCVSCKFRNTTVETWGTIETKTINGEKRLEKVILDEI